MWWFDGTRLFELFAVNQFLIKTNKFKAASVDCGWRPIRLIMERKYV
jgi:hypothetical protein